MSALKDLLQLLLVEKKPIEGIFCWQHKIIAPTLLSFFKLNVFCRGVHAEAEPQQIF